MRLSEGIERARQPRGLAPMRVAAWLLALPVHLVTAALVVLGVWLVIVGDGWGRLLGALPLLTALALRPRLPKRGKPGLMDATAFPECAACLLYTSDAADE